MTELDVDRCRMIGLAIRGDDRGSLIAVEGSRDLPFEIRRAYYIFGTKAGVTRGRHAHHALNQLAVAVSGRCTMTLDDGRNRRDVILDDPATGLIIGPMVWREMSDFSADCVLLVLADAPYDDTDYIRDYDRFAALARG